MIRVHDECPGGSGGDNGGQPQQNPPTVTVPSPPQQDPPTVTVPSPPQQNLPTVTVPSPPQGNLPEVTIGANRPISGPPVIPISPFLAPYPAGTFQGYVNTLDTPLCSYSRANNPNLHKNMGSGASVGSLIGVGLGFAAANLVGFPEVEGFEVIGGVAAGGRALLAWERSVQLEGAIIRAAAQDNITAPASLALLAGAEGGTVGGAVGFGFTSPGCL